MDIGRKRLGWFVVIVLTACCVGGLWWSTTEVVETLKTSSHNERVEKTGDDDRVDIVVQNSSRVDVVVQNSSRVDVVVQNSSRVDEDAVNLPALRPVNRSLPALYVGGCCGVGHRLSRNVLAMYYAYRTARPVRVLYVDVAWSVLFDDTEYVAEGTEVEYAALKGHGDREDWWPNGYPENWRVDDGSPSTRSYGRAVFFSVLGRYDPDSREAMLTPGVQALVTRMRDSASSTVLAFLDPLRRTTTDYARKAAEAGRHHVKLCAHVRQGNNETGDWRSKPWRTIDLPRVLNSTLDQMRTFVVDDHHDHHEEKTPSPDVSVYVASDNLSVRPWFATHIPKEWRLIVPERELPRPDNGVWFGEMGSKTNTVLNQTQKNEAMAESVAEMLALGECDALYVPNFSSFTFVSIVLSKARNKPVFFRDESSPTWKEMGSIVGQPRPNRETRRRTRTRRQTLTRSLTFESESRRMICDEEL